MDEAVLLLIDAGRNWTALDWKDFRANYWPTYYFEKDSINRMKQNSETKGQGYGMEKGFQKKKLEKMRNYSEIKNISNDY